jgi:hypothetical protein
VRWSAAAPDTDNHHNQDDNVNDDDDESDSVSDTDARTDARTDDTVRWHVPVGFRVQMLAGWRV